MSSPMEDSLNVAPAAQKVQRTWWSSIFGLTGGDSNRTQSSAVQRGVYQQLGQNDRDDPDPYDSVDHSTHDLGASHHPSINLGPSLSNSLELHRSTSTSPSEAPTPSDLKTLRPIPDALPPSAFLVAIVELCERAAYYGLSGPFQNYIANTPHSPNGLPGALGLGQAGATALNNMFQFFSYVTPIAGAVIADQYLGKYATIAVFAGVYIVGLVVLVLTSLPASIEAGYALPGLILSMLIIGLGSGGIKANVAPLIAEQYTRRTPFIRTLHSGERVVVSPALTVQRIYMIFYLCVNIGAMSPLLTTSLEKNVGFWSAYLVPLILFIIAFVVLIAGRGRYIDRKPSGSVIVQCARIIWLAVTQTGSLEGTKPSVLERDDASMARVEWTDEFVEELKKAIEACKVFLFFPFYWLVYFQMNSNFISQAGQMELHGIPNDIMTNINTFTVILAIPLLDRVPFLQRIHGALRPPIRITVGFFLIVFAMLYAAWIQSLIYAAPPCFSHPLSCPAGESPPGSGHFGPNRIHVALQTPAYAFIALSEIYAHVTGLEYAFQQAPVTMKSFIMSLYLLTSAFGAGMASALAPWAKDPGLVQMYLGLAATGAVSGGGFWWVYGRVRRVN